MIKGKAGLAMVIAFAACTPAPIRTADGLLVSDGKRALSADAIEVLGQLRWERKCLILERPGVGTFQPVFERGVTRSAFEQQLGGQHYPLAVAVYGFDTRTPEKQGIGSSAVARQCSGIPAYFGRMTLASKVPVPPKPQVP